MIDVNIGYLPLTDAATLIAAADFGFAEREGVRLVLHREMSWASLRDRLVVGQFDAAHFLAPLAVATTLGLGQLRRDLTVFFVLNENGNAITLSAALAAEIEAAQAGALDSWRATADGLAQVVARRAAQNAPALTFATVFPTSGHTYLLRKFLAAGGVDADEDVGIIAAPPPYMVECIDKKLIDGFCVGSPWNSLAVEQGKGVIAALGSEIVPQAVEKALVAPSDSFLFRSDAGCALVAALRAAAAFCDAPEHRADLASALAARFDLPADILLRTLTGELLLDRSGRRRSDQRFIRFSGPDLNRPTPDMADTILFDMTEAGQARADRANIERARKIFSADLFDRS